MSSSGFNVKSWDLSYLIAWTWCVSPAVGVLIKHLTGGNWMHSSLLFFLLF